MSVFFLISFQYLLCFLYFFERWAFSNLEQVKKVLVLGVARLIMKTHSIIHGSLNPLHLKCPFFV